MKEHTKLPICVDLDGTLIREDVTIEAVKKLLSVCFFDIFKVFFWLLYGRARLKREIALRVDLNPAKKSYNKKFLEFIIKKKKEGHKIFLATAADYIYAEKITNHLGIFDGIFASDGKINLRAKAKANALVTIFGERGFIYAGNSDDDVFVWDKSAESILVTPSKTALKMMKGRKFLLFEKTAEKIL